MLRRAALALALTLLSACVHTLAPGSADQDAITAVEEAWGMRPDLPAPGDCLALVEVRRHLSRAAYIDACDGLTPGIDRSALHPAGCSTLALRGVLGKQVVVIHLAPTYHNDMQLVQHEALHALVRCRLDRSATDPWDAQHTDRRVWAATGGAESVQAQAK